MRIILADELGKSELELYTARKVKEVIKKRIDNDADEEIILDLKGIDYIDSTGLGTLIAWRHFALCKGLDLSLANPEPGIKTLFKVTGIDRLFKIV